VLAYSRVPDDQAKPHDQWDGDDHEAASGFPSSNGHIPFERGTVAEVLGELGWNTYMVGKWHLTAEDEMNLASRKSQWPVGAASSASRSI
jgi:arylsulfatase A-like enzyme